MRPRGHIQEKLLRVLRERGEFYVGCGWAWGTYKSTAKMLDRLVERGDVTVERELVTHHMSSQVYERAVYRPSQP